MKRFRSILTGIRASNRWLHILLVFAAFAFAEAGYAQTAGTGSIQGVVTDSTGAVIQNASVTLINLATQVRHRSTSGGDGLYSFPNVPIGTYTVTASAPGFESYTQSNIVLEVGSSIAVNIPLSVGQASQRVEVQANGLALQTEDATFKQTIDQRTLTELPLNGRQVTSLITLSGGAAPDAAAGDLVGSKSFFSSVAISVAGGQGNQTDYRLDGGDHNDYMTNVNLPFPFPDAVSQFSVETTAQGAQAGLHPGGLVNVVTRSGSNEWHGSAFEFVRNNFVDATNFFSSTKDTLHQNQYGGTLGGKIIPNKVFFFGGYQRLTADSNASTTQAHVPTPANLQGDFSVTDGAGCTTSGKPIQLLDPFTGAILAGDKISPTEFVAPALALQKYLPATTDPCGIVFYAVPSAQTENQIVGRVDATLTQKQSLYGSYFLDGYQTPAFYSPTNILITSSPGNQERAQSLTIGETYIINSSTVNSFHATATRRRIDRGPAAQGVNAATLGVNVYAPLPNFLELSLTGKWATYCGTCAPSTYNVNSFAVADDVNMVRGKHQIAFGGEYVRAQLNADNEYESNGDFGFTGIYGQKGPDGVSAGGTGADANLDFLTGAMATYQQSKPRQNALRAPIPNLYIQDTYHATKNLVLSAGVRWDPEFYPTDYFGRGSTFDETSFLNNVHSTVFPNAPAGSFFYGDKGVPKNFTKNSPWQFSPRVGATYDPFGTGKTVLRAGGALVYDEPNFFTAQRVLQNPPFATAISNVPLNVPLSFASPWSNGSTIGNPFPLPFHPPPSTTFPNQSQYIVLPAHFHPPYVVQWTASVQQELSHGWQFQIDYIGNETSFAAYGAPLDPALYIPGEWTGPGSCGALATSPGTGKPCSSTGNQAARFVLTLDNPAQGPLYQGGGAGSIQIVSGAKASYNAMVATLQHRMSNSFTFLANYTWSHCLDLQDATGDFNGTTIENPNDIRMDYANCGWDYRAMFNSAVVATSHFALSGWKNWAFNDWEIAPLIRATDGAVFTVTSGLDNSLTDVGNDRPNQVYTAAAYTGRHPTAKNTGNSSVYLNAAAFAQNATGTYGNVGRNSFRGPKNFQMDAALSRLFPIRERLTLDLRFEAFNVLNHPNFNNPGASLNSSTFGQITGSGAARVFQLAGKFIF